MIQNLSMKNIQPSVKVSFFLLLFLPLLVQEAYSQNPDNNLGLGVVLGEPTGVTAKLWLGDLNAFAATAAWSFRGHTTIHLNADYLRHNFDHINVNKGSVALYYGLGGRLLLREGDSDDRFGIRVPLGISYYFANDPLEIFIEIAPILDVISRTDISGNSGIGLRYYF